MCRPDYFSLFQIATRAGTTFTDDHRAGRPLVAVVNEAFARTYFGRVDATGQTIAFGNDGPREIIGVVADVKGRSNAGFVRSFTLGALGAASAPAVYVPVAQAPGRRRPDRQPVLRHEVDRARQRIGGRARVRHARGRAGRRSHAGVHPLRNR